MASVKSEEDISASIDALEEKLRHLNLNISLEGGGKGQKCGPSTNQNDLRNSLKIIGNYVQTNGPTNELLKVHQALRIPLSTDVEFDVDAGSVFSYFKLLSEVYPPVSQSQCKTMAMDSPSEDRLWTDILEPICGDILEFLNVKVFHECLNVLSSFGGSNVCSNDCPNSSIPNSGTGLAFHRQLGTLLKGVRIYLIYMKLAITSLHCLSDQERIAHLSLKVTESLQALCALMNPLQNIFFKKNHNFDIGLDIRCNIGVGICYSLYFLRYKEKSSLRDFFKHIFCPFLSNEKLTSLSNVEREIVSLATSDINRIALAFAILSTWLNEEHDSELYFDIAKNILNIQHGVKEAVNLGTARVLEIWVNNLSRPTVPSSVLHESSSLFLPLEFFCFLYMPGHIDAVKNCCRNIIGALALIYDRLDEEEFPVLGEHGHETWVSTFLHCILDKPVHIKWIALSCVCRNTKRALKILEIEKNIPEKLLTVERIFKVPASDAYVALMSYHFQEATSMSLWEKTWIDPLFACQLSLNVETNWPQKRGIISTILNSEKHRVAQIQPMIIPLIQNVVRKMNVVDQGKQMFSTNANENVAEASLLAAETIKMVNELKITIPAEKLELKRGAEEKKSDYFRGLVPREVLHQWLWSENHQIRLAGLALLVETKKTTEEVSKEDFESIKVFFKYNLLSQSPSFRQQFVSYFKKFVRRLHDSLITIRRKKDGKIDLYQNFLSWLWKFLTEEEGLFYGANFGRRCLALDCLYELTQVFTDFQIFGINDAGNTQYLRWLKDSYENNKNQALEILVRVPMKEFDDPIFCKNLFNSAITLCKAVKPPESVSGRYLMTLLMRKSKEKDYSALNILESLYSELETMHGRIESTSLIQVSTETPLYGCVRCIRMILQNSKDYKKKENSIQYREYIQKLLRLCFTIDKILFPVLGNAAPEGFIPQLKDSNSDESKQVVRSLAAQMLLVCAWRTMKENCLLMSDICTLFVMEGESMTHPYLLSYQQVSDIGDHLLYLLKNLMHRGVFEQVYVGFKEIADRLWKSPSRNLSYLPERWLQDAMDQEHISAKSITRRSAGLPFIFQALLSAESDNEQFLQKWIQRLLIFDESPELSPIRIHSMNVLRGLFRDTDFSSAMMPFVPHGLRLAFRGLKSQDWTERNSGLMLYGAVMRRSFGPKLNLMNAPAFFRKFPQMYDFLLEELDTCIKVMEERKQVKDDLKLKKENDAKQSAEMTCDFTFHLLLLLTSFTPSGRMEDNHFKLDIFLPKIRKCGENDDIEVRKLSAKALVPFLTSPEDKRELIVKILNEMSLKREHVSQNHLHGLLFQFWAVTSSLPNDSNECKVVNAKIGKDFLTLISSSPTSFFKAPSVFEVIMDIFVTLYNMNCVESKLIYKDGVDLVVRRFSSLYGLMSLPKNMIPGLPITERKLARAVLQIGIEALDEDQYFEKIYEYFTDPSLKSEAYVEQYLELCCGQERDSKVFQNMFGDQGQSSDSKLVIFEAITNHYLQQVSKQFTKFPGTEYELGYLRFMKNIAVQTFEAVEPEIITKLISRLLDICVGSVLDNGKELTTLQIKSNAFTVLGKLVLASGISISQEIVSKLSDLFVEWSVSSADDELRETAAECFPQIPFSTLENFSAINKAKIWTSILMLAQDDETYIREIINRKLADTAINPCCDRKSLEILLRSYFKNFFLHNPIEGVVVLIGLLLREDFEVEAKAADDETEDRLFDKSEMNMYFEHLTLAKTVLSELDTFLEEEPSFKLNVNSVLSESQIKLHLQISNRQCAQISSSDFSIRNLLLHAENPSETIVDCSVIHEMIRNNESNTVRRNVRQYVQDFINKFGRS